MRHLFSQPAYWALVIWTTLFFGLGIEVGKFAQKSECPRPTTEVVK